MKKILILAYDFPPYNSIAAQRPYSWIKYLPLEDIEPTVVTLHWDKKIEDARQYSIPSFQNTVKTEKIGGGKVVRVPFKANLRDRLLHDHGFDRHAKIRKVASFYYLLFRFFFAHADNTGEIFKQAGKLLKTEKYDYILATGEPFILFKYAAVLSRKYKIPWIADYRDTWTNNPNIEKGRPIDKFLAGNLFRKLEERYVSTAKLITTPAPSYKKLIKEILPAQKVEVIYNGSDIENLSELTEIKQRSDIFEIAYAGRFYEHQKLEVFLQGYLDFLKQNNVKNSRLIFYGLDFFPFDKERLLNFSKDLSEFIVTTPKIPYETLLQKLRRANLFLLLSTKGIDWLNAKIFDYLPLQRKILLVCNDYGILEKIMDECSAGIKFDSAGEVTVSLTKLYREFQASGRVKHTTENYNRYTRKQQALAMIKLIKEL